MMAASFHAPKYMFRQGKREEGGERTKWTRGVREEESRKRRREGEGGEGGKRDVVCRVEILFTLQLLEYFTISNHPRLDEGEDANSRGRRCGGEREGEEGVWGRGRARERGPSSWGSLLLLAGLVWM